jgi:predicted  nucleic acid-binding Zn-ribbon protein
VNEQLRLLVELQNLDTEIIKKNKAIQQIPRKLSASEKGLQEAQKKVEEAKSKLDEAEKEKREKDLALKENTDHITKLKDRTAAIKDNKAYTAHLKEIESAEKSSSTIEEDILKLMDEIESRKSVLADVEAALKTEEGRVGEEKKRLEAEVAKAKQELEEMFSGRAKFRTPLEKDLYAEYMELLKRKDGLAVAQVLDEVCGGCHMNIMPQLYVEIKKQEDIHHCPQCGRFLFAEAEAAPQPSAAPPEPAPDTE